MDGSDFLGERLVEGVHLSPDDVVELFPIDPAVRLRDRARMRQDRSILVLVPGEARENSVYR
jgi:hypothetical protein